jgi:3-oxoacyl-[acyl-carrier protein] reductase
VGQLEGRIALVTGASRGIGAGCAAALANDGASVLLVHRDSGAACEEVRAGLAGSGHRVIQADVTDSNALAAAAEEIAANEGRLDLLVNNAGWSKVIPPEDLDGLDDATFDKVMQVNVRGPFACVRAFKDLLLKGTEPSIVNISSVAAQLAAGSNIAYASSKAALDTLTVALARALAPDIRVFSVSPGLVDTDFIQGWDPEVRAYNIDKAPMGRLATPDDIGKSIVAIAAGLTFTTGEVILVDGGRKLAL